MKSNGKNRPHDRFQTASHAAADWIARLKSDRSVPTDEEDLDRWLQEDPKHREAFDRLNAIWDRCEDLGTHPLVVAEQIELVEKTRTSPLKGWFSGVFSTPSPVKPFAAAVTIVLVLAAIWISQRDSFAPGTQVAEYRSKTGAQESVLLADGSTALLDTTTTISVDLSSDIRRVTLVEGRAFFSVTHDPGKPFVVSARGTEVRVLGTEFNVAMRGGKITVAVLKGRVHVLPGLHYPSAPSPAARVSPDGGTSTAAAEERVLRPHGEAVDNQARSVRSQDGLAGRIVAPGQEAVLDERQKVLRIRPANLRRISAWRSGKLDFDRIPLADVVDEINRYLDRKIRIEDEDLGSLPISMVFKISDCNHFLSALGKIIPVVSDISPNGDIMLTRKDS